MIEAADRQFVVSVGELVSLPCVSVGSPTPTITWTRDRRHIDSPNEKYAVSSDGSLIINNISVRHHF